MRHEETRFCTAQTADHSTRGPGLLNLPCSATSATSPQQIQFSEHFHPVTATYLLSHSCMVETK